MFYASVTSIRVIASFAIVEGQIAGHADVGCTETETWYAIGTEGSIVASPAKGMEAGEWATRACLIREHVKSHPTLDAARCILQAVPAAMKSCIAPIAPLDCGIEEEGIIAGEADRVC